MSNCLISKKPKKKGEGYVIDKWLVLFSFFICLLLFPFSLYPFIQRRVQPWGIRDICPLMKFEIVCFWCIKAYAKTIFSLVIKKYSAHPPSCLICQRGIIFYGGQAILCLIRIFLFSLQIESIPLMNKILGMPLVSFINQYLYILPKLILRFIIMMYSHFWAII